MKMTDQAVQVRTSNWFTNLFKKKPRVPNIPMVKALAKRDPDFWYKAPFSSITFFYDPKNGEVYYAPYPIVHNQLLKINNEAVGRALLGDDYDRKMNRIDVTDKSGAIAGRIGFWEGWMAVSTWQKIPDPDAMMEAIYRKFPDFRGKQTVINESGYWGTFVKHIPGEPVTPPKKKPEPPECAKYVFTVDGEPNRLENILAKLHMVRGLPRERLRAIFCSQAPSVWRQMMAAECETSIQVLEEAMKAWECKGQPEKEELLDLAIRSEKARRLQELRKIFSNPEALESEFRTQTEQDKAWDELQKLEGRSARRNRARVRRTSAIGRTHDPRRDYPEGATRTA